MNNGFIWGKLKGRILFMLIYLVLGGYNEPTGRLLRGGGAGDWECRGLGVEVAFNSFAGFHYNTSSLLLSPFFLGYLFCFLHLRASFTEGYITFRNLQHRIYIVLNIKKMLNILKTWHQHQQWMVNFKPPMAYSN